MRPMRKILRSLIETKTKKQYSYDFFSELHPGKGDQIRTRKVLVDGAGGSACLKQDEKENKVCEPCVQDGKLI